MKDYDWILELVHSCVDIEVAKTVRKYEKKLKAKDRRIEKLKMRLKNKEK